MDFWKKVNSLVLGLAVLLAFGCGGDEPELKIDPVSSFVKPECQILTDSSHSEGKNKYTYNAEGRLIRIDRSTSAKSYFYETLAYNAAGKLDRMDTYNADGTLDFYLVFQYNSNGQVSSYANFSQATPNGPFQERGRLELVYDQQGKLQKKRAFSPTTAAFPHTVYQLDYPSDSVVIEMLYHDQAASGNLQLVSTREIKYDDKKNPYAEMPIAIVRNIYLPHNVVFEELGNGGSMTYGYEYNINGYPLKRKLLNTAFLIEDTYTYNCQ